MSFNDITDIRGNSESQPRILVINGPNLNMLGIREPEEYGLESLDEIVDSMEELASRVGVDLATFQSNSEGEIVDRIQDAIDEDVDFILINAGGYTHTSVAIRDALLAVDIPFIEVHVSNVFAREPFRAKSYLSDIAVGVISGFGAQSYIMGLMFAANMLTIPPSDPEETVH